MPFITQGKTNFKYVIIIIVLAIIVGVGILAYQQWWVEKHLVKLSELPELKIPEKITQDETANWKTYRNEEYGFEFKYPPVLSGKGTPEKRSARFYSKNYTLETFVEDQLPLEGRKELGTRELLQIVDEKSNPIILNQKEINFSGCQAIQREEVVSSWRFPQITAYCGRNDILFMILLTPFDKGEIGMLSKPSDFENIKITDELRELFSKILSTFKFIETKTISTKEEACVNSGGTVETSLCCESTSDFPDLCLIGSCGCSPENSHQIKTCDCGSEKCFNGTECVTSQNP